MKFTVHLCAPVLTWEGVEADTKEEAIAKCEVPPYFGDGTEEARAWIAEEVEPEDKDEEEE